MFVCKSFLSKSLIHMYVLQERGMSVKGYSQSFQDFIIPVHTRLWQTSASTLCSSRSWFGNDHCSGFNFEVLLIQELKNAIKLLTGFSFGYYVHSTISNLKLGQLQATAILVCIRAQLAMWIVVNEGNMQLQNDLTINKLSHPSVLGVSALRWSETGSCSLELSHLKGWNIHRNQGIWQKANWL